MENQHKKIKGYRELSQEEIDLMNEGKALAEKCGEYIKKLEHHANVSTALDTDPVIDGRWLAIGKTNIQQGFMSVIRSIAKPTTF